MHFSLEGTNRQLRLTEVKLTAQAGFGLSLVHLTGELSAPRPDEADDQYILQLHGTAHLTLDRKSMPFAAIAPPATRAMSAPSGERVLRNQLALTMPVTPATFDHVEQARDGRALELRLDASGLLQARSNGRQWVISGQPTHPLEAARWEELLEQARHRELVRFAVPAAAPPGTDDGRPWVQAVERLRQAQQDLMRGEPRAAIGQVRHIIELLWPDLPAPSKAGRPQQGMDERFRRVVEELKHVSNLSHHEDEITSRENWSRADAVAAIATVAALMQREGNAPPFE